MRAIPESYINYKSTTVFEPSNVPKMFLHQHNTRAGVYGRISVLSGAIKFYGFTQRRGQIEQEITLLAGQAAVSPPQYWHKVEFLTDDSQFKVDFYADAESEIVKQNLNERNNDTH